MTSAYLDRFVEEQRLLAASDHPGESEEQVPYLRYMSQTGRRVAEMHIALAGNSELAEFAPEPTRPEDVQRWIDDILLRAERVFDALQATARYAEGSRPSAGRSVAGAAARACRIASTRCCRAISTASTSATTATSISARC